MLKLKIFLPLTLTGLCTKDLMIPDGNLSIHADEPDCV